ncbi:hypothetical protein L211DRAFT_788438 [Terfezia boudieri ATCC MYA-4762]|uniref:Exonuclease domain-containing protein n=1 Tax=Terfezia boudieri ATCC MYA-4762 TaxID=1051890 RepID=A0A3N4LMS3_9PEZI|nr:hypothetical protein L211DRAFT_788438 [Terfezia boudieri ATCC MYA-4762]
MSSTTVLTKAPTTTSSSTSCSSKTITPQSPALTYSKAVATKPTPTPAKPILLVPASVARCSAKWGTRTQLLTLLHGEYVRLYQATQQDPMVITVAVEEEAEVARSKGAVYPNVMKNRITALKKVDTKSAEWVGKRKEIDRKRKGELMKGDLITDPSLYEPLTTGLDPQKEVSSLASLMHLPPILIKYGHILTPPSSTDIATAQSGVSVSQGWEICDRCDSRFQTFPGRRESDGALASGGKCTYHWGRAVLPPRSMTMGLGGPEKSFTCCKQSVGQSAGCVTGESHVFKVGDVKRLAGQWQWVETYPNNRATTDGGNGNGGGVKVARAFALDCEMCYTTLGMEMVRLTVVDFPGGEVVIDALVRPKGEILDLNTRFSGVSAKEYVSAKPYSSENCKSGLGIFPSPEAARGEKIDIQKDGVSVLIGHALENDLCVLRLCHRYIVDTCILFPHTRGFPVRNKLAWVAERYLRWRIQKMKGVVKGHDSAVDARCAGELVRWKIKEEVKKGGGGCGGCGGGGCGCGDGGGNCGGGGVGVALEKVAGVRRGKAPGGAGRGAGNGGLRFDGVAAYMAREREAFDGAVNAGGDKSNGMSKRKRGVFTESDGEEGKG